MELTPLRSQANIYPKTYTNNFGATLSSGHLLAREMNEVMSVKNFERAKN